MCLGAHKISGIILITLALSSGIPFAQTPYEWLWLMFGVVAPDIGDIFIHGTKIKKLFILKPRIIFLRLYNENKNLIWSWPEKFLHTIFAVILSWIITFIFPVITIEFAIGYTSHVIIDHFSHKKILSFWPISNINCSFVKTDWVTWRIYRKKRFWKIVIGLSVIAWIALIIIAYIKL